MPLSFTKKLEFFFIAIVVIAVAILFYNYYKKASFMRNELPKHYKDKIFAKEEEILSHMRKNFGFVHKFPIIITDKFQGRLYGLTSYENKKITIYLNKKVMQESMDYMLKSVIAHEYAHALMFKQGYMHTKDDGHSKEWQVTCKKLGGEDCQRYVNQKEIIMSKMPFN